MPVRILALIIILAYCLIFLPAAAEEKAASGVRMLCLNVGKGDAILLTVEGRHYLVDTGYKRTAKKVLTALAREGISRLDGIFITHPHKDHVGGLDRILDGIQTDAIYAPWFSMEGNGPSHPAVQAAAAAGYPVRFLRSGEIIPISGASYFEILGPVVLNTENENNNSLVMNLVTPDGVILLTGDMKAEEDLTLLKADLLAPCTVLKVPFHGDNSASTLAFLKAVRPRVSVISTSTKEEKDTPARDTLARLASVGSEIYVTQDAKDGVLVILKNNRATVQMVSWNTP